jgi:LysR family glycine cleavage system transcriptional activator
MPHLPSISSLQAFEASANRLSFKQAAIDMNLTPGAISRQIQTLEGLLGTPLFVRSRRQVTLTKAGTDYLAAIAPPLAALRAAGEAVSAEAARPVVSIVAYPTFAVRWLIPRWGRFLDSYPDIDLRLTTTLNPADFARGDVDFAIQVADQRALSGPYWKLFDVDLFPVAAPTIAGRLNRPVDLIGETLLIASPRPDDWPRWRSFVGVDVISAARSLQFESLNLAIQAAIEGLGVAIAFSPIVAEDIAVGRLVQPFGEKRRSSRALYLVESTARPTSPARALVRAWLEKEAAAA